MQSRGALPGALPSTTLYEALVVAVVGARPIEIYDHRAEAAAAIAAIVPDVVIAAAAYVTGRDIDKKAAGYAKRGTSLDRCPP